MMMRGVSPGHMCLVLLFVCSLMAQSQGSDTPMCTFLSANDLDEGEEYHEIALVAPYAEPDMAIPVCLALHDINLSTDILPNKKLVLRWVDELFENDSPSGIDGEDLNDPDHQHLISCSEFKVLSDAPSLHDGRMTGIFGPLEACGYEGGRFQGACKSRILIGPMTTAASGTSASMAAEVGNFGRVSFLFFSFFYSFKFSFSYFYFVFFLFSSVH